MKNGKRLIAGILAAIMMISSVPNGTVYAVATEILENEKAADENETISEENQAEIVEEQDVAAETLENDDNDADESDKTSTKSDDSVIDDEDINNDDETVISENINDGGEVVDSEDTTEQVSDEEIVETEEIEVNADLSAATSIDYDVIEAYVVKQLLAERKKNPNAAELTVDVSSYKIPGATNDDMLKLDNTIGRIFLYNNYGMLYFLKPNRPTYQRQQNIVTKITYSVDANIDDAAVQKEINAALATINNNMSDFQKFVVLYDYVAAKCTYDKTTEHCSDIYGALVEGRVKCEGYAHTYKYLCDQIGIDCYIVVSDAASHMWNLVKLDGEYYHVDATGVTIGSTHGAFLNSDSKLSERKKDYKVYKKYGKYLDLKATSTLYDNAEWKKQTIPMTFEDEPKAETYIITYVLNGGINNPENPSSYVKGIAVDFKAPTREGYEFDGWYFNAELTTKIASLSVRSSGDKTIYAKWIKIEIPEDITTIVEETTEETPVEEIYTITYVLNGGINNSENPATYVKGTRVEFKAPTRDGYEFDGWYFNAELTTKIASLSVRSSGDKTIYAKWIKIETSEEVTTEETAETYTITYVLNGGENSSENPATYVKGTKVEFKDAIREGYTFDGWYLDAQFKTKISALSVYSSGDKTIYAKWIKIETSETPVKTYKVTFDVQGRGTAPAAYTGIEAGSTIARPVDPSFDGYRFGGWYKNAACTKAWNFETDTVQANTTLYAKWTYEGNGELDARAIPDMYLRAMPANPKWTYMTTTRC